MYSRNHIFPYFTAVKKAGVFILLVAVVALLGFHFTTKPAHVASKIPAGRSVLPVDSPDKKLAQLYYQLDTFFTSRSIQNGFSGSVLISVSGKPVYEKCFGYCDYRNKDLMHDTAAFQLASVSKNFTATAILWCV